MIDTSFIVMYTNGLYTTPAESAPTYNEFRDMFSSGQLASKKWAVDKLKSSKLITNQHVLLVGAWYGTLGLMIKREFPDSAVTLLDIDPRCKDFLDNIIYNFENVYTITEDMYKHKYTEDVVINTACEHIPDVKKWLDMMPKGTTVLLQSNNYFIEKAHINCVSRLEEFEAQASLSKIFYSGELETPIYTRYMIIGQT